jgi:hypothetical protein
LLGYFRYRKLYHVLVLSAVEVILFVLFQFKSAPSIYLFPGFLFRNLIQLLLNCSLKLNGRFYSVQTFSLTVIFVIAFIFR